nr:hypothetical protein PJ912_10480 [Pectobacterium colocasium]
MLLINLLPWRKNQMHRQARRWLGLLWLQIGIALCLIAASYLLWQHRAATGAGYTQYGTGPATATEGAISTNASGAGNAAPLSGTRAGSGGHPE